MRRRRANGFALLLLVAGVAVSPVLDGWLHGAHGSVAAEDGGDCAVHQLAATQLVISGGIPALTAPSWEAHGETCRGQRAPRAGRGARLTPPSRAPPA